MSSVPPNVIEFPASSPPPSQVRWHGATLPDMNPDAWCWCAEVGELSLVADPSIVDVGRWWWSVTEMTSGDVLETGNVHDLFEAKRRAEVTAQQILEASNCNEKADLAMFREALLRAQRLADVFEFPGE